LSDVCLILEGTYPYVTGGVSACVYQLIKATPHLKYSLVYIAPSEDTQDEYKYPIPSNVNIIKEVYLFDYDIKGSPIKLGPQINKEKLMGFLTKITSGDTSVIDDIYREYFDPDHRNIYPFDLLRSEEAWKFLEEIYYQRHRSKGVSSFIDYFYTWRFTHYPLFKVLTTDLPRAEVYHAMCTGYAGLMGAIAKMRFNKPFVITEHGIYSHEREIEISQAEWVYNTDKELKAQKQMSYFKEWWVRLFHYMGKVAYQKADTITTLYQGNLEKQVRYGAPPQKIQIIANGIDMSRFEDLKKIKPENPTIALVGRVVPIKDIKSFIKAVGLIKKEIPNIKAYIIGPTVEDETYFFDCQRLVSIMDLEDSIIFTGRVDVRDYYPKIDLMILSSISEGQPIVMLEAYCLEVPVVATDVGSCSELVFGSTPEDKELGACGDIVPFGRPDLLSKSIVNLLKDPEKIKIMGKVAKERVTRYYQEETSINNYLEVYNRFLEKKL